MIPPPPEFDAYQHDKIAAYFFDNQGRIVHKEIYYRTQTILPPRNGQVQEATPRPSTHQPQQRRNRIPIGLFASGKIEKPKRDRRSDVDRFVDSNPEFRGIYEKMVQELDDIHSKRSEMDLYGRSKKYKQKHAPIKFDVDNVQDVMTYISDHMEQNDSN